MDKFENLGIFSFSLVYILRPQIFLSPLHPARYFKDFLELLESEEIFQF